VYKLKSMGVQVNAAEAVGRCTAADDAPPILPSSQPARMESQRIRLIEMRCKSAQIARDLSARDAMKTENSPGGA
jgi:hypothetical protein